MIDENYGKHFLESCCMKALLHIDHTTTKETVCAEGHKLIMYNGIWIKDVT